MPRAAQCQHPLVALPPIDEIAFVDRAARAILLLGQHRNRAPSAVNHPAGSHPAGINEVAGREYGRLTESAGAVSSAPAPVITEPTVTTGPGRADGEALDPPKPGPLQAANATAAPTPSRARRPSITYQSGNASLASSVSMFGLGLLMPYCQA